MRHRLIAVIAAILLLAPAVLFAQSSFRGLSPFAEEPPAPPIPADVTNDRRVARNYPEQPPVIPHSIRDYQVTLNNNQCLTCHSRQFTEASQAPMISITHYTDRDGQVLGAVSPRRFFCTQCHVPQTEAAARVGNDYRDIDSLLQAPRPSGGQRR